MSDGLECRNCGNSEIQRLVLTDIGNDKYRLKCDLCDTERIVKFVPKSKEHGLVIKAKVWHRTLTEQEMIDSYNGKDVLCGCTECKPKGL